MSGMRIGILTGGGDVPGLNPCIKAVVEGASERGWEVVGFRRGWAGVLQVDPEDPASHAGAVEILTPRRLVGIERTGGTILHTSRTSPHLLSEPALPAFLKGRFQPKPGQATLDCTPHVLKVLEHLGIDVLVPIGGDGTLTFAAHLHRQGVKVVSIPKTMDNDVSGTDYCIGFSTAVSRSVDCINALRTTLESHERVGFIELFGRNSGETALLAAYLAVADRALVSEVPFDLDRLARFIVEDRAQAAGNYSIVVLSEGAYAAGEAPQAQGAMDAHGNRRLGGIGDVTAARIHELTGVPTLAQRLAYLMRAGAPDALDRMVAAAYAGLAIQEIAAGRFGVMTALVDGVYATVAADACAGGARRLNVAELYDPETYRPRIRRFMGKPMFLY